MGMELVSTVLDDSVPSTGDDFAYFHVFFKMRDGSTIAFFEAPGLPPRSEVTHPAYEVFDHIALQAKDRSEERTSELQSLMRIADAVLCLKKLTHHMTQLLILHSHLHTKLYDHPNKHPN